MGSLERPIFHSPLSSPNYAAFRLVQGRELGGILAWGPATGARTMRGREAAISLAGTYGCDLAGTYVCDWKDYSDLDTLASYKQFR